MSWIWQPATGDWQRATPKSPAPATATGADSLLHAITAFRRSGRTLNHVDVPVRRPNVHQKLQKTLCRDLRATRNANWHVWDVALPQTTDTAAATIDAANSAPSQTPLGRSLAPWVVRDYASKRANTTQATIEAPRLLSSAMTGRAALCDAIRTGSKRTSTVTPRQQLCSEIRTLRDRTSNMPGWKQLLLAIIRKVAKTKAEAAHREANMPSKVDDLRTWVKRDYKPKPANTCCSTLSFYKRALCSCTSARTWRSTRGFPTAMPHTPSPPPPPPLADTANRSTTTAVSRPVVATKGTEKYAKLLKVGVPISAVRAKMAVDGCTPASIRSVCNPRTVQGPPPPPPTPANPAAALKRDPKDYMRKSANTTLTAKERLCQQIRARTCRLGAARTATATPKALWAQHTGTGAWAFGSAAGVRTWAKRDYTPKAVNRGTRRGAAASKPVTLWYAVGCNQVSGGSQHQANSAGACGATTVGTAATVHKTRAASVVIKTVYRPGDSDQDIRRLTVQDDTPLQALLSTITSLYQFDRTPQVAWTDEDGDRISVRTDQDLKEAVAEAAGNKRPARFIIIPASP